MPSRVRTIQGRLSLHAVKTTDANTVLPRPLPVARSNVMVQLAPPMHELSRAAYNVVTVPGIHVESLRNTKLQRADFMHLILVGRVCVRLATIDAQPFRHRRRSTCGTACITAEFAPRFCRPQECRCPVGFCKSGHGNDRSQATSQGAEASETVIWFYRSN